MCTETQGTVLKAIFKWSSTYGYESPYLRRWVDIKVQYKVRIHASASVGKVDHATSGLVFSMTFT
jgi:hypothetical protein